MDAGSRSLGAPGDDMLAYTEGCLTRDLARAVPQILEAFGADESSPDAAARVVLACEQFVRHTARLLGEQAVDMLFERSLQLANKRVPWLRVPKRESAAQGRAELQAALARQDAAAIVTAFVAILSELIGILERLIGPGLVARLLHEVWPTVFAPEVKDAP